MKHQRRLFVLLCFSVYKKVLFHPFFFICKSISDALTKSSLLIAFFFKKKIAFKVKFKITWMVTIAIGSVPTSSGPLLASYPGSITNTTPHVPYASGSQTVSSLGSFRIVTKNLPPYTIYRIVALMGISGPWSSISREPPVKNVGEPLPYAFKVTNAAL